MALVASALRRVISTMDPADLEGLLDHALEHILQSLDKEERMAFAQRVVENSVTRLLVDMDRAERAKLMNDLLPRLLREFPLGDLDIFGALSLGDRE